MAKKLKKRKKSDRAASSTDEAPLDWSWRWHLRTLGLIYAALGVMYFVLRTVWGPGA